MRFIRAGVVALLLIVALLVARRADAWFYAYCPDVANAVAQQGGQFYVTGYAGHDTYFDVDLWNYEASMYGSTFYGICVE